MIWITSFLYEGTLSTFQKEIFTKYLKISDHAAFHIMYSSISTTKKTYKKPCMCTSYLDNLDNNMYIRMAKINFMWWRNRFCDCIDDFCSINTSICTGFIQYSELQKKIYNAFLLSQRTGKKEDIVPKVRPNIAVIGWINCKESSKIKLNRPSPPLST